MNRTIFIASDFRGETSGDGTRLAADVHSEVERQNEAGYKVTSVTNIMGSYQTTDGDYPYAESYTCGVLIIFEETAK